MCINSSSQMICSRCVLPLLALFMLLEQISAAVIPRKPKRVRFPASHTRTVRPKHLQGFDDVLVSALRSSTGRTTRSFTTCPMPWTRGTSLWVTQERCGGERTIPPGPPSTQRWPVPCGARTGTRTRATTKPTTRGEDAGRAFGFGWNPKTGVRCRRWRSEFEFILSGWSPFLSVC